MSLSRVLKQREGQVFLVSSFKDNSLKLQGNSYQKYCRKAINPKFLSVSTDSLQALRVAGFELSIEIDNEFFVYICCSGIRTGFVGITLATKLRLF